MLGIVLKPKEGLNMLIISAKSLFFFKVHTSRVSWSVGVLEHSDMRMPRQPLAQEDLVDQPQGLKPGTWKSPPVSMCPGTLQLEHSWQSHSISLCVKVGRELNVNDAHHQEKGNCWAVPQWIVTPSSCQSWKRARPSAAVWLQFSWNG